MAWDSTKSAGDLIQSADWNSMVTDQKTRKTPTQKEYTGSDCSGSDGDANRVLTLDNDSTTTAVVVIVQQTALMETTNYTVSHGSGGAGNYSTITFIQAMDDTDQIRVTYFD